MEPTKATLPTNFGNFIIYSFSDHLIALTKGNIKNRQNILTRVQSECLTGEVFTSLRCDCRDQLSNSLKLISSKEKGILIYLKKQEGRGIGLMNKINAYSLQDKGFDTVEANHQLGFVPDLRTYENVKHVLNYFNISSISLITNNPEKIKQIKNNGLKIIKRIPLKIGPNQFNKDYLKTKKDKLGHLL